MLALPSMHADPVYLSSLSHIRDLRQHGSQTRLAASARRRRRR
jgi:hypothetical protein